MRGHDDRSSLLGHCGYPDLDMHARYPLCQRRLTGDAKRDEEHVCDVLARFELEPLNLEAAELPEGYETKKRPLVVSQTQAKEELLARLRSGKLKAQGDKCDPFNEGKPVSDTAQEIPARRLGIFKTWPLSQRV